MFSRKDNYKLKKKIINFVANQCNTFNNFKLKINLSITCRSKINNLLKQQFLFFFMSIKAIKLGFFFCVDQDKQQQQTWFFFCVDQKKKKK